MSKIINCVRRTPDEITTVKQYSLRDTDGRANSDENLITYVRGL